MQAVVQLVSQFFMIVLCIYAVPADQEEIRIDLVEGSSYIDTLIVKRSEEEFTIYDEMNGKLMEFAKIRPVKDKKYLYVCTDVKGRSETIDLSQSIVGFQSLDLHKDERMILEAKDGTKIRFNRSASIVYLTPVGQKWTYVVH